MPERGISTESWNGDEWFQDLERDQRYLFLYLLTNGHCNQAGLYYITLTTIANEAKISKNDLPSLLKSLEPKVVWYPDDNLIWVKNFIKRQSKSSKFIAAAAKNLTSINNSIAVQALIDYNQSRYSISIPYRYYIDRISILTRDSGPSPNPSPFPNSFPEEGVDKGEDSESGSATPTSESEDDESLSPADSNAERAIITTWFSVEGFSLKLGEAKQLVARLRTGFPDIDILQESRAWAASKISKPLSPESRISSQIWNWMDKARDISNRKIESDNSRADPDRYIKGKYGHMVQR